MSFSLLSSLRRHAPWLVVVMGLGLCVPALLLPWQSGFALLEVESDPVESVEKKAEEYNVVYRPAPVSERPSTRGERLMADAPSLSGCVPDAPPTPPPDRNA